MFKQFILILSFWVWFQQKIGGFFFSRTIWVAGGEIENLANSVSFTKSTFSVQCRKGRVLNEFWNDYASL